MATGSVENVLVYVSDSLRFDALPESVAATGVTGRGIATSTFTASGFPSILTGTYPATHRVWNFEDALSRRPVLLRAFDQSGIDATHVWSNVDDPATKPPLRICGERRETTLEELSSPFSLVVHDRGGHMLYGERARADDWDSHSDFFDEFGKDRATISELYAEGVRESAERFLEIRSALASRGLLSNTLVVFTSDHGELQGEYGGLYGHGSPLVPELVTVPIVFGGAGLPQGETFEGCLSTADITPTALGAAGHSHRRTDGVDLWSQPPPAERLVRAELWKSTSYDTVEYKASSVWSESGGYVRHLTPLSGRLAHLLGTKFYLADYANVVRRPSRGYLPLAASFLRAEPTYGDPPDRDRVEETLVTAFRENDGTTTAPRTDRDHLRQLGYLE